MPRAEETLKFKGCNFLRQRLIYSLLSGRSVTVDEIRPRDEQPGVKDHEMKLLSLLESISNGTRADVNKAGTEVIFRPGLVQGGDLDFDCGTERCISYFLEPLIVVAPFCKVPLTIKLRGITNSPKELSVDVLHSTWLPIFKKFVLNDEQLAIKVNARGFAPDGGGLVTFSSPIVRILRSVQSSLRPGKICKIRGSAYVCKVSPSIASRMIDSAKEKLRGYIADVYITVDQRKGTQGGRSPGYGLILVAETTEGVFFHGEATSEPRGSENASRIAEDVGTEAAERLLSEIYGGGCMDSSAQILATTFMALGERNVSRMLFGPLSSNTVQVLRHLQLFFGHTFQIEEPASLYPSKRIANSGEIVDSGDGENLRELRTGSQDKVVLTCVGVGYSNINKVIL